MVLRFRSQTNTQENKDANHHSNFNINAISNNHDAIRF
jgi:hypothetical protein